MATIISGGITSSITPPQWVDANFFLSRATVAAGSNVDFLGQPSDLKLSAVGANGKSRQAATVMQLTSATGVKTVVEAIATPVAGSALQKVRVGVKGLGVGDDLSTKAPFYFVTARERQPIANFDVLQLSKPHPVLRETSILMSLSRDAEKLLIVPPGAAGAIELRVPWLKSGVTGTSSAPAAPQPASTSHPAGNTAAQRARNKPYLDCVTDCMDSIPAWLTGIIVLGCGTCVTLLGTGVGATIPPATIALCVGCVVALGGVVAICLLGCP